MNKGDLERLERAGMITNLEAAKMRIKNVLVAGYIYDDVESQCSTMAIYDVSEKEIKKLQGSGKDLKLRRLERD